MTPLALHGSVTLKLQRPFSGRSLVRLCCPRLKTKRCEDVAILTDHDDASAAVASGYDLAILSRSFAAKAVWKGDSIEFEDSLSHLSVGDIVAIDVPRKKLRVLWRAKSNHNTFLVTERCDHYCLMCSQPPRDVDDAWIIDEIRACLSLLPPETTGLGFTGGEPLLDASRFIDLIRDVRDALPNAGLHVLTNGRAFARPKVASDWAALEHKDLWAGIPLYSSVPYIHDYIVQSSGAFDDTLLGILRLKDKGQRVEIRIVLHGPTVSRLSETCRWLARNLPFVDHVALMGIENTGFALANHALLWVDPIDYKDELARAVSFLLEARISTSIYNLPLCTLATSARPHAVRSISDWKVAFPSVCEPCSAKERCAGFFTTGKPRLSRAITPFLADDFAVFED